MDDIWQPATVPGELREIARLESSVSVESSGLPIGSGFQRVKEDKNAGARKEMRREGVELDHK